jgi:hypothetical protein
MCSPSQKKRDLGSKRFGSDGSDDLPYVEWKQVLDALLATASSRAGLYPPGFLADVSREAMYERCGE